MTLWIALYIYIVAMHDDIYVVTKQLPNVFESKSQCIKYVTTHAPPEIPETLVYQQCVYVPETSRL